MKAEHIPDGREFYMGGDRYRRIGDTQPVTAVHLGEDPRRLNRWQKGDAVTVDPSREVSLAPVRMFHSESWYGAYWVTFDGCEPHCVEATTEEAARILGGILSGFKATKAEHLPYPASPRLNAYVFVDEHGKASTPCPSFCFAKPECMGRSSCPRNRSCDD